MARDALVTRGINVRPHRRPAESAAPCGLRISSAYDPTGSPGRPFVGYRPQDFGLRTRTRRHGRGVAKDMLADTRPIDVRISEAELAFERSAAEVSTLKMSGGDWRPAAARTRALRQRILDLRGGTERVIVDVDQGAAGSVASAMRAQD